MDFLSFGLGQICTHWAVTGVDGFNKPIFASPVELKCRWEERNEKLINDDGEEYLSRARVFLANDVVPGDYLFLGSNSTADPRTVREAFRVKTWRRIPSLDGLSFERKAYL